MVVFDVSPTWQTGIRLTSETDTIVGHGTPQVVDIPSENFDAGVPAVPGHYSIAQQLFGSPVQESPLRCKSSRSRARSDQTTSRLPGGVHARPQE